MIQKFVNIQFFYLLVFTLTFGILLYDLVGFDYTDEFCALFLFILFGFYVLKNPEWPINKAFGVTILIFIFYLIYSVCIESNAKKAIISDFLIQIKPYLAFFLCLFVDAGVLCKSEGNFTYHRRVVCYILAINRSF